MSVAPDGKEPTGDTLISSEDGTEEDKA